MLASATRAKPTITPAARALAPSHGDSHSSTADSAALSTSSRKSAPSRTRVGARPSPPASAPVAATPSSARGIAHSKPRR